MIACFISNLQKAKSFYCKQKMLKWGMFILHVQAGDWHFVCCWVAFVGWLRHQHCNNKQCKTEHLWVLSNVEQISKTGVVVNKLGFEKKKEYFSNVLLTWVAEHSDHFCLFVIFLGDWVAFVMWQEGKFCEFSFGVVFIQS